MRMAARQWENVLKQFQQVQDSWIDAGCIIHAHDKAAWSHMAVSIGRLPMLPDVLRMAGVKVVCDMQVGGWVIKCICQAG